MSGNELSGENRYDFLGHYGVDNVLGATDGTLSYHILDFGHWRFLYSVRGFCGKCIRVAELEQVILVEAQGFEPCPEAL
jgi:hypothetical protein